MAHRVFVYGSLMGGLRYHALLAGAQALGPARTAEPLRMLDLGDWPGLREGGGGPVEGELYEVDDATLAELDRLEDVPALYVRRRIALDGGGSAWIYILAPGCGLDGPVVAGGCWRAHLARRSVT